MTQWVPCKRKDFIKRLKNLGFEGPYSGSRHQFLVFKNYRLAIPSNKEYSIPQLKMMIKEAEKIIERKILVDEWNSL